MLLSPQPGNQNQLLVNQSNQKHLSHEIVPLNKRQNKIQQQISSILDNDSRQSYLDKSMELKKQVNNLENDFIERENDLLKREIKKLQSQMNQHSEVQKQVLKERFIQDFVDKNGEQSSRKQGVRETQKVELQMEKDSIQKEYSRFKIQQLRNLNQDTKAQNMPKQNTNQQSVRQNQQIQQKSVELPQSSQNKNIQNTTEQLLTNQNIVTSNQQTIDSRKSTARNQQSSSFVSFIQNRPSITPSENNQNQFSGLPNSPKTFIYQNDSKRPSLVSYQNRKQQIVSPLPMSLQQKYEDVQISQTEDYMHEQYLREKHLLDQIRKLRIQNEQIEIKYQQSQKENMELNKRIKELEQREQRRYDQNLEYRLNHLESNVQGVMLLKGQQNYQQQNSANTSMQLNTEFKNRLDQCNLESHQKHSFLNLPSQQNSRMNSFRQNNYPKSVDTSSRGPSAKVTPIRERSQNYNESLVQEVFLIEDHEDQSQFPNQQSHPAYIQRQVFSQVNSPDIKGNYFVVNHQHNQSYQNTLDRRDDNATTLDSMPNCLPLQSQNTVDSCGQQHTLEAFPTSQRRLRDCCKEKYIQLEKEKRDKSLNSQRSNSRGHSKNQRSIQTQRPISKIGLNKFTSRQNSIISPDQSRNTSQQVVTGLTTNNPSTQSTQLNNYNQLTKAGSRQTNQQNSQQQFNNISSIHQNTSSHQNYTQNTYENNNPQLNQDLYYNTTYEENEEGGVQAIQQDHNIIHENRDSNEYQEPSIMITDQNQGQFYQQNQNQIYNNYTQIRQPKKLRKNFPNHSQIADISQVQNNNNTNQSSRQTKQFR
eukprot:403358118